MSFCRRCSRALHDAAVDDDGETALDLDLRDALDITLAAVWDTAFDLAEANGTGTVGMEHLILATTEVAASAAFLHARGFDVEGLGRESARVVAATAGEGVVPAYDLVPEIDLETTFELAVMLAEDSSRQRAAMDELLEVLAHYEAGDAEIAHLVAHFNSDLRAARSKGASPSMSAAPQRSSTADNVVRAGSQPPGVASLLAPRTGGRPFEAGIAIDLAAGATAPRARPPSSVKRTSSGGTGSADTATGGRGGGGDDLALRLEALGRRMAELEEIISRNAPPQPDTPAPRGRPEGTDRSTMWCDVVARLDAMAAAQLRLEARLDRDPRFSAGEARGGEGAAIVRSLDLLAAALEHQHDEIARLADRLERLAGVRDAAAGDFQFGSRQRDPTLHESRSGDGIPANGGPGWSRRAVRPRRRQSRRLGGLGHTAVAHGLLRRMPCRRERSWWPLLASPVAFSRARRRGGQYRPWGELGNAAARSSNVRRKVASSDIRDKEKRFYLALDHDIVHAPSIGPRTAERLRAAGILKVRDLMMADAQKIARRVATRHITVEALAAWRDQARLVCTVPFLRGTHAQLLVGAGYRTPEAVATADRTELMSAILRFATTRDGQSVLRNGAPPDPEKVGGWMRNAAQAEPARAA